MSWEEQEQRFLHSYKSLLLDVPEGMRRMNQLHTHNAKLLDGGRKKEKKRGEKRTGERKEGKKGRHKKKMLKIGGEKEERKEGKQRKIEIREIKKRKK